MSITAREVEELVALRQQAMAAADAYKDVVGAVAVKHNLLPGALRRYVSAAARDRLRELQDEMAAVQQLCLWQAEEDRRAA